jgi:hypothetical protein
LPINQQRRIRSNATIDASAAASATTAAATATATTAATAGRSGRRRIVVIYSRPETCAVYRHFCLIASIWKICGVIAHAEQYQVMNTPHYETSYNAVTHDDDEDYLSFYNPNLFISARILAA